MANPPHPTYINIPPPPLPEFYMHKRTSGDAPSASSGTEDIEAATSSKVSKTVYEHVHERQRQPAIPGDGTDERHEYVKMRAGSDITSSLAVYHICRICHRPRSARYHREHPIPIDGVPPPPGICRRCRVTSVDDSASLATVVEHHESHGPKLGVKCLVVDEDYLAADKVSSRRVNYGRDEVDWIELEPPPPKQSHRHQSPPQQSPPQQKEYIYRHIHVAVPPPPIHPPPQAANPPFVSPPPPEPMYTYVPKPTVRSTAQDAIDTMSTKSAHSAKTRQYEVRRVEERASARPSNTIKSDNRRVESVKASSSSSKAKNEVEIRTSAGRDSRSKPEWTETEIRKLARDEVERYRQAERKMEAHGDAYAHGRLVPVERVPVVPVERRIEAQREAVDEMPWKTKPDHKPAEVAYGSKTREYRVRSESQQGREEILIVRKSGREPYINDSGPEISPPSEASSDKTRWASKHAHSTRKLHYEEESRTPSYPPRKDHNQESRIHVSREKQKETPTTSVSDKMAAGHWIDYERPQERAEVHERRVQVKESEKEYATVSRRPEHRTQQRVAVEYDRRDSGVAGLAQHGGKQKVQHRTQEVALPYPYDDLTAPVPMPSPSSHASRPAKHGPPRDNDSEYYYKLRTVQPADEVEATYLRDEDPGTYYKETSEYLHRRKMPPSTRQPEQPSTIRRDDGHRRQSDASSRVRFANKVAVSPTPPPSDASSTRFRDQRRLEAGGPDKVVDFQYERRGRSPSRAPRSQYDYFYEQDAYSGKKAHRRQDEGGATRSALRGRRPSGDTETATAASTLPIDVRMLARAQSESPSREKLLTAARRQAQDGFGPYTVQHDRSVSVEAYDGSSVGGGSDTEVRKQRRERRETSRQRGKR